VSIPIKLPCSLSTCEDRDWCIKHERCKHTFDADERAYRAWHDRQMAKPFDERNFE